MAYYPRHQGVLLLALVVVAGAGMGIGHWRRAHPAVVDRLEALDRDAPAAEPGEPLAVRDIRPLARPLPTLPPPVPEPSGTERARPASARTVPQGTPQTIDLNRAGLEELTRLPGVGTVLAARIVETREARRFQTVDDLRRVRGLSRATVERVRPLVTITP